MNETLSCGGNIACNETSGIIHHKSELHRMFCYYIVYQVVAAILSGGGSGGIVGIVDYREAYSIPASAYVDA